jgi:hypothetical protein
MNFSPTKVANLIRNMLAKPENSSNHLKLLLLLENLLRSESASKILRDDSIAQTLNTLRKDSKSSKEVSQKAEKLELICSSMKPKSI